MAAHVGFLAQGMHPIALVALARPERRNAFDAPMLNAFEDNVRQALADDAVRVLVVAAEGSVFCAGADLRGDGSRPAGELAAEAVEALARLLQLMCEVDKPIVARVQGPAVGGGLGFVAASDIVIAAPEASFTLREVRVGAVPAVVSIPLLDRVEVSTLRELSLTGTTVDATTACRLGIVDRVATDLDADVTAVLEELVAGAPGAQAGTKKLLRELTGDEPRRWQHAVDVSKRHFTSNEALEGMSAFAEKRAPNW